MIEKKVFGRLGDGRVVSLYRMENRFGESVELLDFGASIHSISVLDQQGKLGDVTLGVSDAKDLESFSHEGVTIGRVANRIAYGRFAIDGKVIQLECNRGEHFLHGASDNYAHRFFKVETDEENNRVKMFLTDRGETGFGCLVHVEVDFTFHDNHQLTIQYRMETEGDTALCPTNHVYFNLDGNGDILNHKLYVRADRYAPKGKTGMPEGDMAPVEGTPLDFRRERSLGEALKDNRSGFFTGVSPQIDDSLILDRCAKDTTAAARLVGRDSGRCLTVYTDMPAVVVFTPFVKEPRMGKDNRYYAGYRGVALETQFVPNAVNCPTYESPIFRKGEVLESRTVYAFSVEEQPENQ